MWRKQPDSQSSSPDGEAPSAFSAEPGNEAARPGGEGTQLGQTISIKGEISGREDLFLNGKVEGTIRLHDARLTVGPAGRLHAEVDARDIDVHGEVHGTLAAGERLRVGRTGRIEGDVVTQRLAVEEGAVIRGNVEVVRPGEARAPKVREAAAAASAARAAAGNGSETTTKREPVN